MSNVDRFATLAAGAAAVATTVTPELKSWWLAAPAWGLAAIFGVRWFTAQNPGLDFESAVLGDIHPELQPPVEPAASSTLAMLQAMGVRLDRAPIDPNPPPLTWHQLEERFRLMNGEVWAIWNHYESGLVRWSVYSRETNGNRVVERFLSEARIAGKLVRTMPHVPRKFLGATFSDDADEWLNVVAALVHPGRALTGSGRDADGKHESGSIEGLVDASQVACARLASESVTDSRKAQIAETLLQLHHRVVHEILNVPAPNQDTRGPLAAAWIPKAQQWDKDVIETMRNLGCKPDEIHYVETFPLPPTLRRNWFIWDMNAQWTISDIRRERFEKIIDRYLDRPIFTQ